ncbi:hypothetical protein M758_7G080400 [Ceratodon purpureus]|nr:hypothetical protein M758_7G080400 [Ceratodon purpureus]
MGQDIPAGYSDKPRIGLNGGMNPENLRRRDPKSRELLGPLFGQVAVATVRNVLYNGVGKLQNVDKMLANKIAQLRERKDQLPVTKNEDEHLDQRDESGGDCSLEPEGMIATLITLHTSSNYSTCSNSSEPKPCELFH